MENYSILKVCRICPAVVFACKNCPVKENPLKRQKKHFQIFDPSYCFLLQKLESGKERWSEFRIQASQFFRLGLDNFFTLAMFVGMLS